MSVDTYFTPSEQARVAGAFSSAKKLMRDYFRLVSADHWRNLRYDVKTLENLQQHEIENRAFAHLCVYGLPAKELHLALKPPCFYRICLQDDRILDAVGRGHSFIKLPALMLYIATHELVHVLRFSRGDSSFDMPENQREAEEETVHGITREVLTPMTDPDLKLVMDCFSNNYLIDFPFN